MRAAGLSPLSLARPALSLAILVMIAGYLLNLWLVPMSLSAFREFQWEIRNRVAAFLLQEGVFTSMSDDLTVYVRSRDRDGLLRGILVDDARQPGAHATILAERGRLIEGPNGPRVLLVNGNRQELDRQTGRLNVLTFTENAIDLAEASRTESVRPLDMTGGIVGSAPNQCSGHPEMASGGAKAVVLAPHSRLIFDGGFACRADRRIPASWRPDASADRDRGDSCSVGKRPCYR
jgi:hypothetical protein